MKGDEISQDKLVELLRRTGFDKAKFDAAFDEAIAVGARAIEFDHIEGVGWSARALWKGLDVGTGPNRTIVGALYELAQRLAGRQIHEAAAQLAEATDDSIADWLSALQVAVEAGFGIQTIYDNADEGAETWAETGRMALGLHEAIKREQTKGQQQAKQAERDLAEDDDES